MLIETRPAPQSFLDAPAGARLTLALCALAALLEGFDNQSMGVAAPRVIAEFGLSTRAASLVFSSTPFGLFLGAILGGRVADLLGRKRALIVSLLSFGIFSLLTAYVDGPRALLLVRFLTGVGLGGAMPNFISLSSESTQGRRRLTAVTVIMAAMPFGGAISAMVALGAEWGWSWRSIFYAGGLAPIALALVMMRYLKESAAMVAELRSRSADRALSLATSLFGNGRARTTLLLWAGYFFTQLILLLMLNWLPQLIIGLGFTRTQASWTSVAFNVSGAIGAGFLGQLHAGKRRGRWALITYLGVAVALAAVALVRQSFVLAMVACSVAGVFIIGAQLVLFALAPLYYSTGIRGTGVGASVSIGRLGSVVGPLFAGYLLAGGGSSTTIMLGIIPFVMIAGAAAFALTRRPQSLE